MSGEVTAVVPTIPPRMTDGMLGRTLASIYQQTRPPDALVIAVDRRREGAAATRNRAVAGVGTEFVAFLDDDDEWLPHHLEVLLACQQETCADLVYPWFELPVGVDPLGMFGRPFDPRVILEERNYIPVTVLARTEAIRAAGGFQVIDPANPCEDWGLWRAMVGQGAKIVHLPERTWVWNWHGANTSGRADKW